MTGNNISDDKKIITIFTRITVTLLFLLSLYYIVWSAVRAEDFSSIIVYPSAIALSILAIKRVILNKKSYILYVLIAIVLFMVGILGINISALFY
ncbi:hypothetical protein [Solibacillus sp. FSL K6-1126]|uniref:hypothetical protein n=1 Tax=Solibacillus sp. FSL K6-1126 TaxID=2921463 RepID=UPI0030FCCBB7